MKKVQILFSKPARRILGFAMRNLCFASKHKGVTLAVMTAGLAKQSKVYRAKPNPKEIK